MVEKPVDRLEQLMQEINRTGSGRYPIAKEIAKDDDDEDLWHPPAARPTKMSETS